MKNHKLQLMIVLVFTLIFSLFAEDAEDTKKRLKEFMKNRPPR